eukprot:60719-Amphidinium_carterae.1
MRYQMAKYCEVHTGEFMFISAAAKKAMQTEDKKKLIMNKVVILGAMYSCTAMIRPNATGKLVRGTNASPFSLIE